MGTKREDGSAKGFSRFLQMAFITIVVFAGLSAQAKLCPNGELQGAQVTPGLYQMTGTELQPGDITHVPAELPDPAPPYVTADGHVEIYGSAVYYIRYDNWDEFLNGGCYAVMTLGQRTPSGSPFPQPYGQPWDNRKFRFVAANQQVNEVIVGGAMSATGGRPAPVWPDDNINRRIYFFRPMPDSSWLRDVMPIFGPAVDGTNISWLGHSYGGNFLQQDSPLNTIYEGVSRAIGFFYEKVTDDTGNTPFKTELFVQPMDANNGGPVSPEIKIFTIGANPYPSSHRSSGGYLAEGPRPIQVQIQGQTFFIIGFSSGDFSTDGYTINYLWSRSLFGPYTPKLTADGHDLLDLGQAFKQTYQLSWVGRPAFFVTPDGRNQMLFHAVQKRILPDNDYAHAPTRYNLWDFFRAIFKVDVAYTLDANGEPEILLNLSQTTGTR